MIPANILQPLIDLANELLVFLHDIGFVYGTVKRRVWFADLAGGPRPTNLRSLR